MNKKTIIIIITLLVAIIAVAFAAYSVIKNQQTPFEEEDKPFFSTIFPFGGGEREVIVKEEELEEIIEEETGESPKLRHVSSFPIAGMFTFLNEEDEEVIRYVEKGTGHIYETKATELGQKKVSNTTIPGIYEAVWIDEDSVILRYFDEEDLESFYAEIIDGSLDGSFLESNIQNITVQNGTIRYFMDSILMKLNPNGTSKVQLYNSSFGEWSLDWWNSTLAFLTTKPSSNVLGSSFFLNTNTGGLTKILKDLPGLTILPNKETDDILFLENTEGLQAFNTETGEYRDGLLTALPEKCIWFSEDEVYCGVSPFEDGRNYPDDWYKGVVSFSDNIWVINLEEGYADIIEILENTDVINPTLSPSKEYLLFTNKKDSTLWSLRLED